MDAFAVVKSGNADIIRNMLAAGINVDIKNRLGDSLIKTAIIGRNAAAVSLLVNAGADVDIKDRSSRTPLYHAVCIGNDEIVRALIAAGATYLEIGCCSTTKSPGSCTNCCSGWTG